MSFIQDALKEFEQEFGRLEDWEQNKSYYPKVEIKEWLSSKLSALLEEVEKCVSKEDLALLGRIYEYLSPSMATNLVYFTPAQSLRNAADAIERKERDLSDFSVLLNRLSNLLSNLNKLKE